MTMKDLLDQAAGALESEIETVREKPSSDLLLAGRKVAKSAAVEGVDYKFETHQPAIRFAEQIRAKSGEKEWTVQPVSFEKNEIQLRFPEPPEGLPEELYVEWENDFVLKRTLQEIHKLSTADDGVWKRIESLFHPQPEEIPVEYNPVEDGRRNSSQRSAIEKAMRQRTLFIWGPPGTGKTATLGFIIANYLMAGKSVLFVSNTNRAVDVGMLSTLRALDVLEAGVQRELLTRFGEAALDDDQIQSLTFDAQTEKLRLSRMEKAGEWSSLLEKRNAVMEAVEKRLRDGKQPTSGQNTELELIDLKISNAGGREKIEEKIEALKYLNERSVLKRKQLVGTTLAKVCTSDLFFDLEFDAVVVDEGSMANLPYLLVVASRARLHTVIVGDPMQLPPIALTDERDARDFLERDIFTTVSGADTTDALFTWQEANEAFTAFFDTQYRLKPSLADVISTVFYEGKLRSGDITGSESENGFGVDVPGMRGEDDRACQLVDTSKYNPYLETRQGERGFNPVNPVHNAVLERLIGNMLKSGIDPEDIGVMLPFRSPVYDLRNLLYQSNIRNIEVGTIHTFQGREKPYIIFDTVMSGDRTHGADRHYSVRLFDEEKTGLSVPRLLNVAFSRSQKELIILADMQHIQRVYGKKFLGRLLEKLGQGSSMSPRR